MRKILSGTTVTLLLMGIVLFAINVKTIRSSETIYIRADGNIDPPTAPISNVDNIMYIFSGNISDDVVVERNNIIIDGGNYHLLYSGLTLAQVTNVTVKNINMHGNLEVSDARSIMIFGNNFYWGIGILLVGSSRCYIYENKMGTYQSSYQSSCIELIESDYIEIYKNNLSTNAQGGTFTYGIALDDSSNNIIRENNITTPTKGAIFLLSLSNNNTIYDNTIYNSSAGIIGSDSFNNRIFHNQFINNTYQVFLENSTNIWDDGYPSGGNYWSDFADIDEYNGPYQNESGSDGIWDHPYIIDEYNQDNYPIVPEFPSALIVFPLLMIATLLAAIVYRRNKD